MLSDNDIEQEIRAERRMSYQFLANQIDAIKSHQWSITHYGLLVFAGIVGITTILGDNTNKPNLLLSIMLWVLCTYILVFIIYMLYKYQINLRDNRRESIELETTFERRYKIREKAHIPLRYFNYWYQGQILFSFKLSLVLGWGFTMWYIYSILIN
jgi:hypothetical protein